MRYVIDIETLKKVFTITFLDYDSEQCYQFEISRRINQFQEIKDFYLNKMKWNICFNGIYFDNIVMNWLIEQKFNNKDGEFIAYEIYKVAQITINQEKDYDSFKPYSKYKYKEYHKVVDLFCYWAKMSRLSKKLSLKTLACSMGMSIEEMPIPHYQDYLTDEEIELTKKYNENDCVVTKELAKRLKDQINLRIDIAKNSGINVLSYDAPKIASELLLDSYCKKTYDKNKFPTIEDYKKEVRNKQEGFYSVKLNEIIDSKYDYVNEKFQDLLKRLKSKYVSNTGEINEHLVIKNPDSSFVGIDIGSGGIHGLVNKKVIKTDNDYILIDLDINSQYPSLLLNYKLSPYTLESDKFLELYNDIKTERLKNKKLASQYKKEKNEVLEKKYTALQETGKLQLNGTYGMLGNSYSYLKSFKSVLTITINGQLLITQLADKCLQNNINIIMLNTDGASVLIKKSDEYILDKIVKEIELTYNVEFEKVYYDSMFFYSVNDYYAIKSDGEVKAKGECNYKHILDGSNEFTIIPYAVKEFLQNNIPVSKTINQCNELWRFCKSQKVDKKFKIFYQGKQIQQLNRYFVSTRKDGAYLYKSSDDVKMLNLFKDTPIYICNEDIRNVDINNYPINRDWYIRKAEEKLQNFFPSQTTLF